MVLEHGREYPSPWAAIVSVSQKIGCSAHTLNEWVKKAEFDGVPSEVTEKLTFRPRRIPSATLSQWPATPVDLQDMVATRRDRAACRPR
jgi:transposase-like protein